MKPAITIALILLFIGASAQSFWRIPNPEVLSREIVDGRLVLTLREESGHNIVLAMIPPQSGMTVRMWRETYGASNGVVVLLGTQEAKVTPQRTHEIPESIDWGTNSTPAVTNVTNVDGGREPLRIQTGDGDSSSIIGLSYTRSTNIFHGHQSLVVIRSAVATNRVPETIIGGTPDCPTCAVATRVPAHDEVVTNYVMGYFIGTNAIELLTITKR